MTFFRSAFLHTLLLLAACTTDLNAEPTTKPIISYEEQKQGEVNHAEIFTRYGGRYQDMEGLETYAHDIARRMIKAADLEGTPINFYLMADDDPQAGALIGGHIYVTRGILGLAWDEAEVAAVIGHEIGHITARHSSRSRERNEAALASGTRLSIADMQRFSRENEYEADALSVVYLIKAGYDPYAAARILRRIGQEDALRATAMNDTAKKMRAMGVGYYPDITDRVNRVTEQARTAGIDKGETGFAKFRQNTEGLPFGQLVNRPRLVGQVYTDQKQKFRITFPKDYLAYTILNGATANHPETDHEINLRYISLDDPTTPEDLLKRIDIQGVFVKNIRTHTVGDRPAASGTLITSGRKENKRTYGYGLTMWAGDDKTHLLIIHAVPLNLYMTSEKILAELLESFETFTEDSDPLPDSRIHYTEITSEAEADTIISRMNSQRPADDAALFGILNGLAPGQKPRVGSYVKLVR